MIWPWENCTHSVSLSQSVRYCSIVYLEVLLVFFCLFACLLWKLGKYQFTAEQFDRSVSSAEDQLAYNRLCWAAVRALLCDSIILNSQLAVCLPVLGAPAANPSECLLQSLALQCPGLVLFGCSSAWVASFWAALQKFCCHGSSRYSFQHTCNGVNAFFPSQAKLTLEWNGIHCTSKSPFPHLGFFWHKSAVDLSVHPRMVHYEKFFI